jgi:hypothetical protein
MEARVVVTDGISVTPFVAASNVVGGRAAGGRRVVTVTRLSELILSADDLM